MTRTAKSERVWTPVFPRKKQGVSTSRPALRAEAVGGWFLACGTLGFFLALARGRHSDGKLTHRCVVSGSFYKIVYDSDVKTQNGH
ncbi:hypothetical protein TPHV1_70043 [Treponema phagedenis]|uniref:Uncharacterized protein n=1 Tax=Treponema phagedenis TaxID=162 RepID=A0A0B7H1S3_TREPH|nr:hypothetical protein TPHV1_70043 [Treponema phagedenis]